jgi:DNA-directed RNA polymerase specialized sigma24 family protein
VTGECRVTHITQPDENAARSPSFQGQRSLDEPERALLALVSAGDRAAMEELYVLYFAGLANFFLHLTTRRDLVDDLIIDTMVEVWKEGASLAADTSVSVAMMRLAYSFGRKRVVEAGETRPHLRHDIPDADHDSPLPKDLDTASNEKYCSFNLPIEERALLHLVYARGHSRSDIAYIMNISCECVDLLLGDARLRRRLVP